MNHWMRGVLEIPKACKIPVGLAKVYVDDVRLALGRIMKGLRCQKEERLLIYDPAYAEKYADVSDCKYMCMILSDILDSIAGDMKFTQETQCDYPTNFLPTFDFEVQLTKKGIQKGKFRFFQKPMATKLGIL